MTAAPDTQFTAGPDANAQIPRIGDLLLERGMISEQQISQALEYQRQEQPNRLLGRIFLDLGFVTTDDLVATLADAAGIPFVQIDPANVDADVLTVLPREFLDRHNALPLSVEEKQLTIAIEDFTNVFLIEDIRRLTGCFVRVVAGTAEDIRNARSALLGEAEDVAFDQIIDEIQGEELKIVEKEEEDLRNLENAASDSPVIKLVNSIISGAIQERASDIHIEPDDGILRVRYRIDGDLYEKTHPPYKLHAAVVSRIKIMADMGIAERRLPQDGSVTVMIENRPVDLRISTMPAKFGEKVVMRIIDQKAAQLQLEKLGFSPELLARMRGVISQSNGVFLVTGPTGSGKSTTLYASLAEIVTVKLNVSTVEDPIEYNLPGVNQFQMNTKIGFTFAKALRALLRQDPDVLMVGEIRDNETAQIATEAALTGHFVLSTLHTNDAPSAVPRLINMAVEPYLVAATLRGVLAQRLVRRLCTHCKQRAQITPQVRTMLEQVCSGQPVPEVTFRSAGCSRCRNTGCSGRVGIYELFVPDEQALEAISRGATLGDLRRMAQACGYQTLRDDALQKARDGVISAEALLDVVTRREEPERDEAETQVKAA